MPERDDAYACSLCHTGQVRDRDAGHTVDRVYAVELERVDDEMKAIRQFLLCIGCICINGCGFQHRLGLPDCFLMRRVRRLLSRDSPDDSRTGLNILDFPGSLQGKSAIRTATARRVKKMKLFKGDSLPIFLVSDGVSQQTAVDT